MTNDVDARISWRNSTSVWLYFSLSIILVCVVFMSPIQYMVHIWNISEEYGYGYIIPIISLFFIWQRKDDLSKVEFNFSYAGPFLIALGGGLFFLGEIATTHTLSQYGLVVTVHGVFLSVMGWRAYKIIMVPLAILFFMVPLPQFIYQTLSAKLQLVSSGIGVAVIRLFDISVYLEGNVIDLGTYKLQVVEACSGLRYLFPLVSLSFLAAYMYRERSGRRQSSFSPASRLPC